MALLAWSALGVLVVGMVTALVGAVVILIPRYSDTGYTLAVMGGLLAVSGGGWLLVLMLIDLYSWSEILISVAGMVATCYLVLKITDRRLRPRVEHDEELTKR